MQNWALGESVATGTLLGLATRVQPHLGQRLCTSTDTADPRPGMLMLTESVPHQSPSSTTDRLVATTA